MTITSGIYIGLKMTQLELKQAARIKELEELLDNLDETYEDVCEEYETFMRTQMKLNLAVIDRLLADADTIKELTEKNQALELRNDYLLEDLEFMESSYDDLFDDYHDMEEFYLAIVDDTDVELGETEEYAEFLELEINEILESKDMVGATIVNMMEDLEHERKRVGELECALVGTLVENDTLQSKITFLSDRMRRIAQFCA
jgi:chromosome segregation ATPase